MIDKHFIVFKKKFLLTESRISRMAVYGVKIGNIKVFSKH